MNTDDPHLKCHLKSQISLHICPHHHVVVLKLRCRRSCHNANKICTIIEAFSFPFAAVCRSLAMSCCAARACRAACAARVSAARARSSTPRTLSVTSFIPACISVMVQFRALPALTMARQYHPRDQFAQPVPLPSVTIGELLVICGSHEMPLFRHAND